MPCFSLEVYAVTLKAAIPYQGRLKSKEQTFQDLLVVCNDVTVLCDKYIPQCFFIRGVFKIPYPVVLYCLENNDCIKGLPQDSPYRRFEITGNGREYLSKLRQCHELFAQKNDAFLQSIETEREV